MNWRHLGLCCWLWLAVPMTALAQSVEVSGSVVDDSGAGIGSAQVVLSGAGVRRETSADAEGAFRFEGVTSGAYELLITREGFKAATRTISVASSPVALPPSVLAVAGLEDTVVVSASRTQTLLSETPSSMTVVSESAMRVSPSQNYGDLLRSVPGLNVIQLSARDINITGRQATSTLATSQLALIDGRSLYLDFFGLVLWDAVAIERADIDQIEVVRGPASSVWGANALTGVINILTKRPRAAAGRSRASVQVGLLDRDAGSTAGRGAGATHGVSVSTSQAPNDTWSFRLSAGYTRSPAYPRPVGQIPVVQDPRDPSGAATVGGALYPLDATGTFGAGFQNSGSTQPRFDVRVDQELDYGQLTYAGGVSGTSGIIYTGIGPFKIQEGSLLPYARTRFSRGALQLAGFVNLVNAEADHQLLIDPGTMQPVVLDFTTQSFDLQADHARTIGRHGLTYGASYRRNRFDITLAPAAKDRNEIGAYAHDAIALGPFTLFAGARLDKFGNIPDVVPSPRLALAYQPVAGHSLRVSFNRAFRSPSAINDYIDEQLVIPTDISELAPLLPDVLKPLAVTNFPLVVQIVGSQLPIGAQAQPEMREESVTAYEWSYLGTFGVRTTVGASVYVNDYRDQIQFYELPRSQDPYTAASPPPGWQLPPSVLASMAQLNVFLPRTAYTYRNVGPTRQKGLELSLDRRLTSSLTASANYSWQGEPTARRASAGVPPPRRSMPPAHRVNVSFAYDGRRYLGSLSGNYSSRAFWSDVLTSRYHGFTSDYTLVNAMGGVKWAGGRYTTVISGNNLLNRTIQQHVFGDLIRRSVSAELRVQFP